MGSRSILSMAFGPRHDRIISATLHIPPFRLVTISSCIEGFAEGFLTFWQLRYLTSVPFGRSVSLHSGYLEPDISNDTREGRLQADAREYLYVLITTTGACILGNGELDYKIITV